MIRISQIAAAFIAGLVLLAGSVRAQPDAFWCGTRLIRERMAAEEVIKRCGNPDATRVVEEPIYATNPSGHRIKVGVHLTEYWTFSRGTRQFPARLTVRDGVVEEIELVRE